MNNGIKYFTAPWCSTCKIQTPIMEKFKKDHKDIEVKIIHIDNVTIDKYIMKYNLMSTPTLIWFKDGKEVDRHNGIMNEEDIFNIYKSKCI